VRARWNLHLKPAFGLSRVIEITSDRIQKYVDVRQNEGAANATINRELAALKRMFHLGAESTPPKVLRIPAFPHLEENNIRTGFLEDGQQYRKLFEYCPELWFRALVECGRTYGWRVSELLNLRVSQIDLAHRVRCSNGLELQGVIRLEPGTTKNKSGREVVMTPAVYTLLQACVTGKKPNDAVFTRPNGKPVKDFRETWRRSCDAAGLGKILCRECSKQIHGNKCEHCASKAAAVTSLHSSRDANRDSELIRKRGRPRKLNRARREDYRYQGLLFHDLRRTAARNLRRKRNGESVVMKIGGWKTASVFRRYDIVDPSDVADAAASLTDSQTIPVKTGEDQRGSNGHVSVHSDLSTKDPATPARSEPGTLTFMASAN
jgi:integrase